MNWVEKFKSGLFSRTQVIVGIGLTMLITSTFVYAFQLLTLFSFAPDTPISSTEVNYNFAQLNDALSRVPVGVAVGLTSTFTLPSFDTTVLPIDRVLYDFTENQDATTLSDTGTLPISETGFYQFLIYPRSFAGDGEIRIIEGGTPISSQYMNVTNTNIPNGNHVFLESGMDISVEANAGSLDLVIDPTVFKIKVIKF